MNISPNIQALNVLALSRQIGANNIANMNTPDFKASRLSLETGAEGQGVRAQGIDQDLSPGPMVPALQDGVEAEDYFLPAWGMAEGGNTDLVVEMVNSIRDERAFQANATMVRSWVEMAGTILDLHA